MTELTNYDNDPDRKIPIGFHAAMILYTLIAIALGIVIGTAIAKF